MTRATAKMTNWFRFVFYTFIVFCTVTVFLPTTHKLNIAATGMFGQTGVFVHPYCITDVTFICTCINTCNFDKKKNIYISFCFRHLVHSQAIFFNHYVLLEMKLLKKDCLANTKSLKQNEIFFFSCQNYRY